MLHLHAILQISDITEASKSEEEAEKGESKWVNSFNCAVALHNYLTDTNQWSTQLQVLHLINTS